VYDVLRAGRAIAGIDHAQRCLGGLARSKSARACAQSWQNSIETLSEVLAPGRLSVELGINACHAFEWAR
jgi:hypothetical protein